MLHTVPQAAALLAVSENTVWNLIRKGELRGVKIGTARRIAHSELERYVDSLTTSER